MYQRYAPATDVKNLNDSSTFPKDEEFTSKSTLLSCDTRFETDTGRKRMFDSVLPSPEFRTPITKRATSLLVNEVSLSTREVCSTKQLPDKTESFENRNDHNFPLQNDKDDDSSSHSIDIDKTLMIEEEIMEEIKNGDCPLYYPYYYKFITAESIYPKQS